MLVALQIQQYCDISRWGGIRPWPLALIATGIGLPAILGFRRLEKYTDQLAKERIRWLRGGQGEALVALHLTALSNAWHVFHNVMILTDYDLDHVLIGPGGLFCISTKSWRGRYTCDQDGTYFLNGERIDHIHEAQRLAMQLKDRLTEILGDVPWVQPVLIAPLAHIGFQTFQKRAWVLHEGNLCDVFENAPNNLTKAEIDRCAKAVSTIAENGKAQT